MPNLWFVDGMDIIAVVIGGSSVRMQIPIVVGRMRIILYVIIKMGDF